MWLVVLIIGYLWIRSQQDQSADQGGELSLIPPAAADQIIASLSDVGSQVTDVVTGVSGEIADIAGGVLGDPLSLAASAVKGFEGFSAKPYPDPPGQAVKYSIGYGHQIRPGDPYGPDSVITETEADALLKQDLQSAYNAVLGAVRVQLSAYQVAALVSFAYNVGSAAFRSSTLLQKVNNGDLSGAALEFGRWIYAGGQVSSGLVARRQQEESLFVNG